MNLNPFKRKPKVYVKKEVDRSPYQRGLDVLVDHTGRNVDERGKHTDEVVRPQKDREYPRIS